MRGAVGRRLAGRQQVLEGDTPEQQLPGASHRRAKVDHLEQGGGGQRAPRQHRGQQAGQVGEAPHLQAHQVLELVPQAKLVQCVWRGVAGGGGVGGVGGEVGGIKGGCFRFS